MVQGVQATTGTYSNYNILQKEIEAVNSIQFHQEDDQTALINIYQRAINYAYRQVSIIVSSVGDGK